METHARNGGMDDSGKRRERSPGDMAAARGRRVRAAGPRLKAEAKDRRSATLPVQSPEATLLEETRLMLHELRVHQTELERQNEELRRAQVELDFSRARYVALYDLAPVGYVTLSEGDLILDANLAAGNLLGMTRAALLDRSLSRCILSEDEDIYCLFRNQFAADARPQPCELRMVRNDNTLFWARLEATLVHDSASAPVLNVALSDITEHKRAEEERRKLDLRLQESQKIESLGVLAGGIAHDFNNLLTAVMGNVSIALMELSPESPVREIIEEIETAARRAADLTGQMLAYSGKVHFFVEPLNLPRMVEEMGLLLEALISRQSVLEYHFSPNTPVIEGDAGQVRQVMMNLIINASESGGGVISISTGKFFADRGYLSGAYLSDDLAEGDYAFLEVADTGSGMDQETLSHIFEPFFSTKFTGRGLGLAAVLGIVRGHRGAIKVSSEVGSGTSFKVLFPVSR